MLKQMGNPVSPDKLVDIFMKVSNRGLRIKRIGG